jgi:hypothetical protein
MATEEQLAAFQTAVASGNIQEAANIAASAGYSPQQVAEYVNANAPILGLGPETGFSGVTAANLNPYFVPTPVSGPPSPAVSPVVANPISLTSAGTASLGQPTNASSPVNVFSPADYGPPSPIFDPAPAPVDPNVEKFNSLIREDKFGEAGVLATGLGFTPEQIQSYLNDTNVFPEFGGGVTLETVQSIVSPPPPPVVSDSPPVVNQTSAPTTPPAYDIRDLFLEFLGREPKKQDLDNAQFLYGDKLDTPDEINEFITKSKQEILNRQSFPVNSLFEGGKQPSLEELRRVQNDPLTQALNSYDQYLLAGQYPEAKALLDSTIATYGLNPTESYANMATYLNTNPKFEDVRKVAGNKLFTGENIANFGKPLPPAPVGPAGGIYQRTPQEQAAYASQLASIPVNTAVPLPVMPMSIGPSAALTRARQPGAIGEEEYYGAIRNVISSGDYTPAQLRQMQQQIGTSGQDINVAFGRGMTPISATAPTLPGATAGTTQSIDQFIQSRAPTTSVAMPTAPSMFSPENVRAQLELERLRLQPTPEPPPEEPVAGFAQGGLVSDDINRMLQNQRNAIQRESQSRQMLTNLGAPPVKKFSDGGPAGSSSGVRRLKMSGYQAGGEVNENPYVRMAREERAAQDKAFDSVNRQLSDLLERYKEGDEGITEKDLLPFFPGYNEYDIAQMYGTTTESSVPSMSSKARSFTPEIMSNLRKHDELMQKDFDSLVKEKRLPRDVITARTLGLANGGEVTNDEFIQEMFTGTRPEDFSETSPVDKKAGELLRALSEGTRGFVGAEPIEPGSEAYRTGQALANMPAVGVVAATAKGAGKSAKEITDFIKNAEGSPLVVYRGLMLGENTSSGALKGKGREGYASFGSSSPYVAASYGTPSADEAEKLAGTITPLLIKASKVVEFPVTTNRYGSRQFDKFEFDRRAQSLKSGEVLVARDVVDIGPRASTSVDPEKLYSYGSDIYAWGPETETVSAITKKAKGAGKSVDQAKALMERMTPELEKFLKDSVVKERLYRGQRRAPAEEGFALTQGRGTPSFTTDTEVANVYSRQLGFGNPEYGPGSTVVPAYVQMKNPLDIRDLGEYIDLESFVDRLPNVDLNKPTVKNGFGYEDIAKMVRGIGSVASKTGAKYEIEASSPGSIFRVTEFDELADAIEELGEAGKSEKIQEMLFDTSIDAFLIGDSKNVKNALKEKGFDGVIHKDAFDVGGQYYQGDPKNLEGGTYAEYIHDSYRPFFQEKIKSAVGNVGTYDTTKKAITKANGGEVTNDEFIQEMMTGTRPTDETTSPGILPPELREAIDVPLDFANLLIRGTAAVPIGGAAGLYKGITGGKYGTQEGVKEADTEAARMMAKITGEPKTQTAKDVLEFIGGKAQEYKLDAALPQLLTLPSPGPGAASALMRSYELAETPPSGVVKMPGGNWLEGQVEHFVRSLKKDIPWTQSQLEEMPGVAKAEAPNLALNKFIETGLTRYIKNDMASAKDTLRNLADENTIKAGKAYNNDLRQVKKAYDRAEKIKAEGPRPNMLPGTWENAIEAQLGRARQLEEEANRKLNLELRHALPFPVLQEDGELAGGLNFHIRRNLQTGGKETLVSSRKEAGQAEEGVAQTPTGKVWETMADLFVKPQAAGQITDQDYFMRSTDSQRVLRNNPWLATVPPETPVYIPQDVFRSSSFLNSFSADDLGFKHITDELANAMNPESGLPANLLLTPDEVANMGMEKAARHVIEVNKWREEQMGVANALRAQKSISLYKDYPTIPGKTEPNQRGLQWLELKLMPEDDTPESMVKAKEALADALKYEGEVMGHCVGGECPKVESGKSRIISLRDAKGEPHATLEVIPPEVNFSDVLGGNPAFPNRDPELYRMMDTMTTTQIEKTPLYKEKAAAIAAQKLPGISQIKGKGNNRPPDSYQPFITDFIASQQWSSVGDLQNTNLVRIEPMILKNAQDRGFNPQIVTTIKERPYITKEEFNRLADLFGGMNKYAAGGEVTDFIKRAA